MEMNDLGEIKKILHDGSLLAIIIPHDYRKPGITFCTEDDLSQQMAYMEHPTGHVIEAHVHNPVKREVHYTKETLIIRRGKLRVDFYDDDRTYLESTVISDGDIILLVSGGHGFKVLERVEMIEVKQGPYAGDGDKTRFPGIPDEQCRMI